MTRLLCYIGWHHKHWTVVDSGDGTAGEWAALRWCCLRCGRERVEFRGEVLGW